MTLKNSREGYIVTLDDFTGTRTFYIIVLAEMSIIV